MYSIVKKDIQRFVVGSKSMGDLIYNLLQIQTSKYQILWWNSWWGNLSSHSSFLQSCRILSITATASCTLGKILSCISHKQGDRLDRQISDLFLEPRGKQGTQFVFSYHQFSFSRPSILLRGWYLRSAQLPLMNIPYHFALNWCQTSFS